MEGSENFRLRLRFFRHTLGILTQRDSLIVFPSHHHLDTFRPVTDGEVLLFYLVLNGDEVLLERRFAENKDVMAGLSAESPTCAQRNCRRLGGRQRGER